MRRLWVVEVKTLGRRWEVLPNCIFTRKVHADWDMSNLLVYSPTDRYRVVCYVPREAK